MPSYIEESKKYWERPTGATTDDLQLGCLQRIASAAEAISENSLSLIAARDFYKRRFEEATAKCDRISLSNRALRGVITRLKKKS